MCSSDLIGMMRAALVAADFAGVAEIIACTKKAHRVIAVTLIITMHAPTTIKTHPFPPFTDHHLSFSTLKSPSEILRQVNRLLIVRVVTTAYPADSAAARSSGIVYPRAGSRWIVSRINWVSPREPNTP